MTETATGIALVIPTIGRIVHYRLSQQDAVQINRRRVAQPHDPEWPVGAQAHVGNTVSEGDVVPLVVIRNWSGDMLNGQALLDGNDPVLGYVRT